MIQSFVITLREGLEAFLIVAISLAYLRKSGRHQLVPAVHWGIGLSVVLSVAAAWLFQRASNQALWEGLLALMAAVLVASLIVHMWRHAKRLKREIESHLEASAAKSRARAFAGVFLFTSLMITREGMEMAFITGTLVRQAESAALFWGALVGIALAAALAWAWSRYGHRVNLALFFQVTSIFLILFALQLCVYAFHEATEANVLPIDNQYWHVATEPYGPEGKYGTAFTYALVLIPALWLAWSAYSTRGGGAPSQARKS